MEKVTHRLVTRALADIFNLPSSARKDLIKAAVSLDRIDSRSGLSSRRRHHGYWSHTRVQDYVKTARQYYLQGRMRGSMWYLGAALHLAQDLIVPSPSESRSHHVIESRIGALVRKRDVKNDVRRFLESTRCPHEEYLNASKLLVFYASRKPLKINDSYLAMMELSAKIAYAVLGPVNLPKDVEEKLRDLRNNVVMWRDKLKEAERAHQPYVRKAWKSFLKGLFPASVLMLVFLLLNIPLLLPIPMLLLIYCGNRALKIVKSDKHYYETVKRYEKARKELKDYSNSLEVKWYIL